MKLFSYTFLANYFAYPHTRNLAWSFCTGICCLATIGMCVCGLSALQYWLGYICKCSEARCTNSRATVFSHGRNNHAPFPQYASNPSLVPRPIATAPTLSKVFKWCILLFYGDPFSTSPLQFGFKPGMSADM